MFVSVDIALTSGYVANWRGMTTNARFGWYKHGTTLKLLPAVTGVSIASATHTGRVIAVTRWT